ncbi:hypothetical protein Avbf_10665 [Armadillidium vulgare]|nr:hypothetical protein Avbf_10665 [Armadillidium vulgare]
MIYITDDIDDDDDDDDDEDDKEGENYKDQKNKTDVDGKSERICEKKKVIHVRFDFVWKAMRSPLDIWKNTSCRLLADSLAREAYADWSNFSALEKEGYDQWGTCHGTINIGEKQQQTWYLRGVRQHSLVMGYVQTASGFHYPVTSTSLEVSEIL